MLRPALFLFSCLKLPPVHHQTPNLILVIQIVATGGDAVLRLLHISKTLFKEMFNMLLNSSKLTELKSCQSDSDTRCLNFLQQEKTQVRWNAEIQQILLPTTRGPLASLVIVHIADNIMDFLEMWTGSNSLKRFILSKNGKKTTFPKMLNYFFRDFSYFLFS